MTPGQREQIMSALFALVQESASFNTASRRLVWCTSDTNQPSVYVRHVRDEYDRPARAPNTKEVRIHAEIWIYCQNSADPAVAPETQLNGLVDAVEQAVDPDNGVQTLGGLVQWVRIEGPIELATGDTGDQAIAYIPVLITVP